MVTVTSPRERREQEIRNLTIQVAAVAGFFLSIFAVVYTMIVASETGASGGSVMRRLPQAGGGFSGSSGLAIKPLEATPPYLKEWPPLSEVYDGRKVIADPQFLLDFAIVGFEKSGTSTLMKWLDTHPKVQCFQEEIYDVYRNRTGSLVWRLHSQLPHEGLGYKRGYKSPVDIFNANALHLLDEWFPKTRLILALRHPVLWYESLYNFRIQNLDDANGEFIEPNDGIGECKPKAQGCCTDNANFGQWMYRMGKTNTPFPTPTEIEMLAAKSEEFVSKTQSTRNPVFVVELNQLHDTNLDRKQQLQTDLQQFLGLNEPFGEENGGFKPGKKWSAEIQAIKDQRKINICRKEYRDLRKELMRVAKLSSIWIRESFMRANDVYVSSPDYFEEMMIAWMDDPCDTRPVVD